MRRFSSPTRCRYPAGLRVHEQAAPHPDLHDGPLSAFRSGKPERFDCRMKRRFEGVRANLSDERDNLGHPVLRNPDDPARFAVHAQNQNAAVGVGERGQFVGQGFSVGPFGFAPAN